MIVIGNLLDNGIYNNHQLYYMVFIILQMLKNLWEINLYGKIHIILQMIQMILIK